MWVPLTHPAACVTCSAVPKCYSGDIASQEQYHASQGPYLNTKYCPFISASPIMKECTAPCLAQARGISAGKQMGPEKKVWIRYKCRNGNPQGTTLLILAPTFMVCLVPYSVWIMNRLRVWLYKTLNTKCVILYVVAPRFIFFLTFLWAFILVCFTKKRTQTNECIFHSCIKLFRCTLLKWKINLNSYTL